MKGQPKYGFREFFPNKMIQWNHDACKFAGEQMNKYEIPYFNAYMRTDRMAKLFEIPKNECEKCMEGIKSAYGIHRVL